MGSVPHLRGRPSEPLGPCESRQEYRAQSRGRRQDDQPIGSVKGSFLRRAPRSQTRRSQEHGPSDSGGETLRFDRVKSREGLVQEYQGRRCGQRAATSTSPTRSQRQPQHRSVCNTVDSQQIDEAVDYLVSIICWINQARAEIKSVQSRQRLNGMRIRQHKVLAYGQIPKEFGMLERSSQSHPCS